MTTCITGTGLYIPPYSISNEELVESFNQYVDNYNAKHADAIEAGTVTALEHSSAAFIEKVSGIKSRYVMEKDGILDPEIMAPVIAYRNLGEELSIMAEMGAAALKDALADAGLEANDLDGIILACSNFQRTYPAVSIEIQNEIGMIGGFAYDMNVACSAATFGLSQAHGSIVSGLAKRVAVVNVEITSAHLNWRNRDSHFIFGDVATACIVEELDTPKGYEILNAKLFTQFSTNIKNEYGFMDRSEFLAAQTEMYPDIKMMWLHQANANMLDLILRTVIGKEADKAIVPSVIDEFANTSSASPMIVFHRYKDQLNSGDLGVICSFGAGYSIGSVLVRKV